MSAEPSVVKKTERAIDDLVDLAKRRRLICLIVLAIIIGPILFSSIYIPKLRGERDESQKHLEPFQAAANQHFQDIPEDKRLDALLSKMDDMWTMLQDGNRDILLKLENIGNGVDSLKQQQSTTGDRSIPQSAMIQMTSSLEKISGWQADIQFTMGNPEAYSLANQIKTVFEKAGWKIKFRQAVRVPIRGLAVTFSEEPSKELQHALLPLFDNFNYPHKAFLDTSREEKTVEIFVGTK
jgi:hypothetical protein